MALTQEQVDQLAPTVSAQGIALNAINTRLGNVPDAPQPQSEPTITNSKIGQLFNAVTANGPDIIANAQELGGIPTLASQYDLTERQTRTLLKEFINLLTAFNESEE